MYNVEPLSSTLNGFTFFHWSRILILSVPTVPIPVAFFIGFNNTSPKTERSLDNFSFNLEFNMAIIIGKSHAKLA